MPFAAYWYTRLQSPQCTLIERVEFAIKYASDPDKARSFDALVRLDNELAQLARRDAKIQAMVNNAYAIGDSLGDDDPPLSDEPQCLDKPPLSDEPQCLDEPPLSDKPPLSDEPQCLDEPQHGAEVSIAAGGPRVEPNQLRPCRPRKSAGFFKPFVVAASLCMLVLMIDTLGTSQGWWRSDVVQYSADAGQVRTVNLADGSVAYLDSGAQIQVRISATAREIALVKGRALFNVAHETDRPFLVRAGVHQVTAMGTRFLVQRDGEQVLVTLEEGSIEVALSAKGAARHERLVPGEQLLLQSTSNLWQRRA